MKGSRSRLRTGLSLTRGELLLLALMSSENRAAAALGQSYPGGLEAFVDAMNAKAALLDMTESRFVEPTGLSPANVSTASDLAKMVRAAHDYPLIREYSTKSRATVKASGRPLQYGNTNGLVRSSYWEIGLSKTGYISEAGRCLVMQVRLGGQGPDRGTARFVGQAIPDRRREPPAQVARERRRRPAARASGAFRGGFSPPSSPTSSRAFPPAEVAPTQVFLRCRGQPPVRAHLPPSRVLRNARRARAHARHLAAIARFAGRGCQLIEYGSGEGIKSRLLIRALRPAVYVPIDISEDALRAAARGLAREFPWLRVVPVAGDFSRPIDIPVRRGPPSVVYFPGSTIGNLTPEEAHAFSAMSRGVAARMLVGVDLKKDPALLHAAYNDAAGVTAAFNLNLLARINRELGADFDPRRFRHYAFYNPAAGRIEMHLVALEATACGSGGIALRSPRARPSTPRIPTSIRPRSSPGSRRRRDSAAPGCGPTVAACSPYSGLPPSAAGSSSTSPLDHTIAGTAGAAGAAGCAALTVGALSGRRRTRTLKPPADAQILFRHHRLDHAFRGAGLQARRHRCRRRAPEP